MMFLQFCSSVHKYWRIKRNYFNLELYLRTKQLRALAFSINYSSHFYKTSEHSKRTIPTLIIRKKRIYLAMKESTGT